MRPRPPSGAGTAYQPSLQSPNLGHQTWFDGRELTAGADWEWAIEDRLDWRAADRGRGYFLPLMTPHAVRRPNGYCLNELARAIARELPVVPVMVETCEPPLSICRLQWLDMRDCVPLEESAERYRMRFARLVEALERGWVDFEAAQSRLAARPGRRPSGTGRQSVRRSCTVPGRTGTGHHG